MTYIFESNLKNFLSFLFIKNEYTRNHLQRVDTNCTELDLIDRNLSLTYLWC